MYGKIGSRRKVKRTHRFPFVLRTRSGVSLFLPVVNFSEVMTFVWASEPSSALKASWKGTVSRRSSGFACQHFRRKCLSDRGRTCGHFYLRFFPFQFRAFGINRKNHGYCRWATKEQAEIVCCSKIGVASAAEAVYHRVS